MTTAGSTKVLDLDAELRQLEVTLKGETFELRSRAELSVLELQEFSSLLKRYDELTDIQDGDAENAAQIGAALQEIAATIVKSDPPADGFSDQQCASILNFWTEQHQEGDGSPPPPRPRRAPQDHKKKQTRRSTGAK